jgi:hypothetical protein
LLTGQLQPLTKFKHMDYFKKIETITIIVVILILGAAYGVLKSNVQAPATLDRDQAQDSSSNSDMLIQVPVGSSDSGDAQNAQQVPASGQVKYTGQDGRTAMDLLKENYNVETGSFGELGEFVKSIDGVEPDSTHFWAFYVNGQIAQVGADTFVTSSVDEIEWKLERIE